MSTGPTEKLKGGGGGHEGEKWVTILFLATVNSTFSQVRVRVLKYLVLSSIMMGVFLSHHNQSNFGLYYKEMHVFVCMFTYISVRFLIDFFPFSVPLGCLKLIIVQHFPKKVWQCRNAMVW